MSTFFKPGKEKKGKEKNELHILSAVPKNGPFLGTADDYGEDTVSF